MMPLNNVNSKGTQGASAGSQQNSVLHTAKHQIPLSLFLCLATAVLLDCAHLDDAQLECRQQQQLLQ
jgi:hypothetical protein